MEDNKRIHELLTEKLSPSSSAYNVICRIQNPTEAELMSELIGKGNVKAGKYSLEELTELMAFLKSIIAIYVQSDLFKPKNKSKELLEIVSISDDIDARTLSQLRTIIESVKDNTDLKIIYTKLSVLNDAVEDAKILLRTFNPKALIYSVETKQYEWDLKQRYASIVLKMILSAIRPLIDIIYRYFYPVKPIFVRTVRPSTPNAVVKIPTWKIRRQQKHERGMTAATAISYLPLPKKHWQEVLQPIFLKIAHVEHESNDGASLPVNTARKDFLKTLSIAIAVAEGNWYAVAEKTDEFIVSDTFNPVGFFNPSEATEDARRTGQQMAQAISEVQVNDYPQECMRLLYYVIKAIKASPSADNESGVIDFIVQQLQQLKIPDYPRVEVQLYADNHDIFGNLDKVLSGLKVNAKPSLTQLINQLRKSSLTDEQCQRIKELQDDFFEVIEKHWDCEKKEIKYPPEILAKHHNLNANPTLNK